MIADHLANRRAVLSGIALGALMLPSCSNAQSIIAEESEDGPATKRASMLIDAARQQIGVTLSYDPSYTALSYPGGDVPRELGVCTDVVIRAYRDAFDIDLQQLVHEDMKANFGKYPENWQLRATDRNIDHRRVPNLQTFLTRQGAALPVTNDPADWLPGDIFTSKVGGRFPHIGIVSKRTPRDELLAVHNIGSGAREEAVVFAHKLDGHFRWRV